MSDPRNILQKMFEPTNRFANFGDAIISIQVSGVRCHSNTAIELNSPIVAFSGLNGTGKSTILQLAACAYRPTTGASYNIGNFIVANQLDPTSVAKGSSVKFGFWTDAGSIRPLTLSYTNSWNGYNRRTVRPVLLAGIGHYLPRSESPSFMYRARTLKSHSSLEVATRIRNWTCKILAQGYDEVTAHQTNIKTRLGDRISSVKRNGIVYSESNMGFGEARALHLIQILETIPERSLVLIEEPETSLHLGAQQEFGHYLVDVCITRKHQILLTSHSEFILQALPAASRIYLDRRGASIHPVPGLTPTQARSLMADGKVKALSILVEDETAKAVLSEIIRRHEPGLLPTWGIHIGGDKDRIGTTVRCVQDTGIALAAVRDGDVGDAPKENIYKLPGTLPPEKEIFHSPAFEKYLADTYSMVLADFRAGIIGTDHHQWFGLLASKIGVNPIALIWESAKVYVSGVPEIETSTLVTLLKEASQQKKAA
jgi:predicted ATPase